MMLPSVLIVLLIAVPLAAYTGRAKGALRSLLLAAPAAVAFVLLIIAGTTMIATGEAVSFRVSWVPQLGLDFALSLNGVGLLLGLLVTGIGALILAYAGAYMGQHTEALKLFVFLYAFMLSMAGLAISDHLLLFFVFWELTSITSYLLIGYQHTDEKARRNALQALLVTGLGGMALLAGFILLANVTGTWYLSEMTGVRELVTGHTLYPAIFTLIVLGAFTKSAQFPFHFWLPNAMVAPTPVSAYLHSATMVKAGVFLLFLMLPVIGGTPAWELTVTIIGGITLLVGCVFGLRQHDLKTMLAGTTLAVLGLLTLLLGIGSEKAVLAALLFMMGHALYKATLFMMAGSVDHETGTRDARLLGGLRKSMPWTAAAALLAAASMMGLPLFFGFLGKEYTYKASLYAEMEWLVTAVLILGNAMLFALAIKAAIIPFWSKAKEQALPKHPHEAPWPMFAGPLLLAVLGVIFGIFPFLLNPLITSAQSFSLGAATPAEIKLWQGFNLPLLLSGVTVALGLAIASLPRVVEKLLHAAKLPSADDVYDRVLSLILGASYVQTRALQSGYLRNYLLIIILSTGALILSKLWRFGLPEINIANGITPTVAVMSLLMVGATFFAVTTSSRLTALVSLGVAGYGVAMLFAYFSAPDLAITQILVETLTVVLFAWVVYKLPAYRLLSSKRTVAFDAVVSCLAGGLVTLLVIKSNALSHQPSISQQLAEWSMPLAYGANIVNVILVDFRALDTLGEIGVLAIAALGVWALLKGDAKTSNKPPAS